jgi:hypothetical protein
VDRMTPGNVDEIKLLAEKLGQWAKEHTASPFQTE